MNKRTALSLLCLSATVGLALTACDTIMPKGEPKSDNAAYPTAHVGVSVSSIATNPFFQAMNQSFKDVGTEQPSLTLELTSADNDEALQLQQLDDMVKKGAKALVVNLVSVKTGAEVTDKYCKQNIPVVYFNRSPGDKNLAGCQTAYFVDGDAAQAGVLQGLKVLSLWKENPNWDKNKDGKIQFAILQGIPGHAGSEARTKWVIGTMQNYPNLGQPVESLFQDHAMFQRQKAQEIVQTWIADPNFQNVEVILANNDTMALGIIDALKAASIKLPVFGIDGSAEALKAVQSGDMQATVLNDANNQARTALRLAANLAAGVEPLSGIPYKMEYRVINVPYQEIN
ncbi:MAG: galactose ABC transporter substrate-binding protein [Moraxella sp.]|nr:galactose ABC transporter substrate-binding protein [Moraxella sp.]